MYGCIYIERDFLGVSFLDKDEVTGPETVKRDRCKCAILSWRNQGLSCGGNGSSPSLNQSFEKLFNFDRKLPMGVRAPSLFHNFECNCIQIRNFKCSLYSEPSNTLRLRLSFYVYG